MRLKGATRVDVQGWDERHRASVGHLEAEPLVVSSVRELVPGRALDLACGTGRNAVWLAEHGWQVTAVDFSSVAIGMLRQRGEGIDSRVADLERGEYVIEADSWDLILMCRYLQRDLFGAAKKGLVAGGLIIAVVLLEGRYGVNPGELAGYFEGFEILHSREGVMGEMVARRPAELKLRAG